MKAKGLQGRADDIGIRIIGMPRTGDKYALVASSGGSFRSISDRGQRPFLAEAV